MVLEATIHQGVNAFVPLKARLIVLIGAVMQIECCILQNFKDTG